MTEVAFSSQAIHLSMGTTVIALLTRSGNGFACANGLVSDYETRVISRNLAGEHPEMFFQREEINRQETPGFLSSLRAP